MKIEKQNVPFTMVANEVLIRKDLSLKAKGLFALIFSKPDGWDYAADRIALECKEERKAIQATLRELESSGLLKRKRQGDGRVKYSLEFAGIQSPKMGLGVKDPKTQSPSGGLGHGAEIDPVSNKDFVSKKDSKKEGNTVFSFEDFWGEYPRKEAKKKAEQIYNRICEADRAAIKLDLPRRKLSDSWQRGFAPHATTYLNGERWNDEINSTPTGGPRQTVLSA